MKYLTGLIYLVFFFHASAQEQGNISGAVNMDNNIPGDGALITLHALKDSAVVKTTLSDNKGSFDFQQIKEGTYFISIRLVGYTTHFTNQFKVNNASWNVTLPPIKLILQSTSLGEVVVQAVKPFIIRKADRIVLNVENSIISTGSTALEVLEKAPGVLVNQESGINLKGKSGVNMMIDGKSTPLSGTDLINYLKSIPSDNIEKIEIITNPSAKYDASGNAGIIDIRFKKDKRDGYNGSAGLSIGQGVYNKPSANTSINYRKKKWNVFTTDAFTAPKNFANFYINRKFFNGNTGEEESIFDQTTFTKMPQRSANLRLGADYYASKKTVLGVLLNGTFYKGDRDGLSDAIITNPLGSLLFKNQTANILKDKRHNLLANFNVKHTIDSSGKELNADIDFGRFNARPLQDIFTNTFDSDNKPLTSTVQNSNQQSTISIKSFKVDYTLPLQHKARFEMGIKSSFVTTDNDVKFYDILQGTEVLDVNKSNHFVYTENVNAAYTNYSKDFENTSLQFGLRLEHTYSKGNQITSSQNLNRKYVQLFPSFSISQKLNPIHEVSFSYSRRIDRPTYRQLNPFKILVDNYTYVLGDPYLKPVLTNSYQVGYTFKSQYNATLSYLNSIDAITDVFVQDDVTKISSQVPANIQNFHQYDLALNFPISIKKWMNSNINGSVYYNKYSSALLGGQLENSFTSWDISGSNSFILNNKGWTAELNGFYQSRNVWGQFIIKNLAQVSAGIQKTTKDKKSVYKFAVADLFSTNHIAVIVKYLNQDWHTDRTWDSRFATFSYTYRFGKNTIPKSRLRMGGMEDEKKRAG
ncbi:MAG: TonB-dependent receptor [Saprospiraceae bacterium]